MELIELLDKGTSLTKDFSGEHYSNDYVNFQRQIRECALKVADSIKATGGPAASSKLAVALDEIAQSKDAELLAPTASKETMWIEVDDLLKKLTKYSGDRKVRPYSQKIWGHHRQ